MTRRPLFQSLLCLSIGLSVLPGTLAAQTWSVDTYAGKASYDANLATVDSTTAALGLRYNKDRRVFEAAAGAPLSDRDITWGVVELGDRVAIHRGGLTTGADVSIFAHAHWDPVANVSGKGVAGEVLPMISHNVGAGFVEFRSGARWYGARLGSSDLTRTLWTTDVRGSIEPTERLRLEGSVRHDRAGRGENYTRPGVSLAGTVGRVSLSASAGKWFNSPTPGAEWEVSGGVPLKARLWLVSGVRHETFDSTFLISPRTSWGAGLTFQIGDGFRRTTTSSREVRQDNKVVLRVPLREARSAPAVAGDFTNWKSVRMARYDGEWRLTVSLPSGVYHFAFRDENGKWFVPSSFPNRVDDGMGGRVAVLVIP
jgi:hypothetical protein